MEDDLTYITAGQETVMLHSKLPLDGDLFRNNLSENCNLSRKSCRNEEKKYAQKLHCERNTSSRAG